MGCLVELSGCMILSVIVIVYFSYNTNTIILPKYSGIKWWKVGDASGLNKDTMYAVSFHSDLRCNYAPRTIDLRCVYNISNAAVFNWLIEAAHAVSNGTFLEPYSLTAEYRRLQILLLGSHEQPFLCCFPDRAHELKISGLSGTEHCRVIRLIPVRCNTLLQQHPYSGRNL